MHHTVYLPAGDGNQTMHWFVYSQQPTRNTFGLGSDIQCVESYHSAGIIQPGEWL